MEKKIKAKSAVFIGKKPRTMTLFIPGLFGSLISTVIISVGLFVFDWRMALASLWVVPVSLIIVLLSYKVQDMRECSPEGYSVWMIPHSDLNGETNNQ